MHRIFNLVYLATIQSMLVFQQICSLVWCRGCLECRSMKQHLFPTQHLALWTTHTLQADGVVKKLMHPLDGADRVKTQTKEPQTRRASAPRQCWSPFQIAIVMVFRNKLQCQTVELAVSNCSNKTGNECVAKIS